MGWRSEQEISRQQAMQFIANKLFELDNNKLAEILQLLDERDLTIYVVLDHVEPTEGIEDLW